MNNPFTLSFGKKPIQYVSRIAQTSQIVENFISEYPSNQVYMITGVRGSGKTVMMTAIAEEMRKKEDYPVFLLMTGLYENIYELQNDKSMTFLYRAPKLVLEPLNYTAVRAQCMDIFGLDADMAGKMTALTKGVINTREYGKVSMALPRFEEFVKLHCLE